MYHGLSRCGGTFANTDKSLLSQKQPVATAPLCPTRLMDEEPNGLTSPMQTRLVRLNHRRACWEASEGLGAQVQHKIESIPPGG